MPEQPNLEWYIAKSVERRVSPRCPFATVEGCPRYYQSVALLGRNGFTALDERDDARLFTKWQHTDVWPMVREDETSIMGGTMYVNWCPEVAGERFGWFASSLARYADAIDSDAAHQWLGEQHAPADDYRWAWHSATPQHYTECPLYAPLQRGYMTDYWSMKDEELEQLAMKYNIPPISRAGSQGEHWYIDRDRIIDALLKRDTALHSKEAVSNVVHVQTMIGSSIQQGSHGSTSTITFTTSDATVRKVLEEIKANIDQLGIPDAPRQELIADVLTVEAQISAPHPKPSIITECLHSMRTILEGAAGSIAATGIAELITAILK